MSSTIFEEAHFFKKKITRKHRLTLMCQPNCEENISLIWNEMQKSDARKERFVCSMQKVQESVIPQLSDFLNMTWHHKASRWLSGKRSTCSAGDARDVGSIPGSGRSLGGGRGNPLQYSCLENPMDRGAWWATVHEAAKSQTWLKWLNMHTHMQTSQRHDTHSNYVNNNGIKLCNRHYYYYS